MTIIADHPDTVTAQPAPTVDPPDGLNHYVSKADITRAIVEGIPAVALCGVRLMPSGRGGGKTGNGRLRTCDLCRLAYDILED